MTSQSAETRLILSFVVSVAAHLLFMFTLLFSFKNTAPTIEIPFAEQRFEIEKLTTEQVQRIRSVGKKGGTGQGFAVPMAEKSGSSPSTKQDISTARPEPKVSFEDLSPGQSSPRVKPSELTKTTPPANQATQDRSDISLRLNDQQSRLARQQQVIQGDVLKELRSSAQAAEVLRSTGFNLQFDPPDGIEESELNTVEKIFYSFQRRTYTSYVTTFISNYHQMTFQRSRLKSILERESHDLTGRVIFNSDGDVISIRIIKGSPSDEVEDLFEKTLKDLKLPNPPRDLLRDDGQFIIYYRLKIN